MNQINTMNRIVFISILLCFSMGAAAQDIEQEIARQDSLFFAAYNSCDIATQEKYYSDSIEFYHDGGGLIRSKSQLIEGIREHICGKVLRQLVPGSLEITAIPGFGAIEIGYHRFHNLVEKSISAPGRFVIVWQKLPDRWIVTRVISLH